MSPEWQLGSDGEQLTLITHFTPLVLSTMSKYTEKDYYTVSTVYVRFLSKSKLADAALSKFLIVRW